MFMAFRRSKMQTKFSLTNIANHLLNIPHFYDHKNVRKLFYLNNFLSCYYWHRLSTLLKFWNEKTKNVFFEIFYLKKFQNRPLKIFFKNRKSEHHTWSIGYGGGKFRVRTLILNMSVIFYLSIYLPTRIIYMYIIYLSK